MQRSCVRLVVYILNYEVLQGRSLAVCFLCWPCIARGTIKGSSTASQTWSLAKAWPWPNFATLFLYFPLYTKCFIQVSCLPSSFSFLFLKKYFIYLFCKGRRRKGEREGEKHQCVIASGKPPNGVPGQQPRHLPWWGIDPATLLVRRPAFHWATPARAVFLDYASCCCCIVPYYSLSHHTRPRPSRSTSRSPLLPPARKSPTFYLLCYYFFLCTLLCIYLGISHHHR